MDSTTWNAIHCHHRDSIWYSLSSFCKPRSMGLMVYLNFKGIMHMKALLCPFKWGLCKENQESYTSGFWKSVVRRQRICFSCKWERSWSVAHVSDGLEGGGSGRVRLKETPNLPPLTSLTCAADPGQNQVSSPHGNRQGMEQDLSSDLTTFVQS